MSELAACRVCLAHNVRFHAIRNTRLQILYENLTNYKLIEDGRPEMVCYMCRAQLQKCQRLADKSEKSEDILTELSQNNIQISQETMAILNKELKHWLQRTPIETVNYTSEISVKEENFKEELEDVDMEAADHNGVVVKNAVMCRVCLTGTARVQYVKNTQLQAIYETITNNKMNKDGMVPHAVCCMCRVLLQHCRKLVKKANRTEQIITELLRNGVEMTQSTITMLNRKVKSHLSTSVVEYSTYSPVTNTDPHLLGENIVNTKENENSKGAIEKRVKETEQIVETTKQRVKFNKKTIGNELREKENEQSLQPNIQVEDIEPRIELSKYILDNNAQIKKPNVQTVKQTKLIAKLNGRVGTSAEIAIEHEHLVKEEVVVKQEPVEIENVTFEDNAIENGPAAEIVKEKIGVDPGQDSLNTVRHHVNTQIANQSEINNINTLCETYESDTIQANGKEHDEVITNASKKQSNGDTHNTIVNNTNKIQSNKDNAKVLNRQNDKASLNKNNCYENLATLYKIKKVSVLLERVVVTDNRTVINGESNTAAANTKDYYEVLAKLYNIKKSRVVLEKIDFADKIKNYSIDSHSELNCKKCNVKLKDRHSFSRHVKAKHPNDVFGCHLCKKKYGRAQWLNDHIMRLHTGLSEEYICDICNKTYKFKSGLRQHMVVHYEKKIDCTVCKKTFANEYRFKMHNYRTHHAVNTYKCEICNKVYKDKSNLEIHLSMHVGTKRYTCDVCNKAFTHKLALKIHISSCHRAKKLTCKLCDAKFLYENTLRIHMRIHTKEKPYTCDTCQKSFRLRNHLKEHLSSHIKERRFMCKVCKKTYTSKAYLRTHSVRHSGKKYPCDVCNKLLSSRYSLKLHIRTHTGDKRYVCLECDRSFVQYNALVVHKRVHSGEKIFSCDICQRKFGDNRCLISHKHIAHTKRNLYICDVCNKLFTRKSALIQHVMTHNGKIMHSCDLCKTSFHELSALIDHLKSHSDAISCPYCYKRMSAVCVRRHIYTAHCGIRPLACNVCEKTFIFREKLYQHTVLCHKKRIPTCHICNMSFQNNYAMRRHVVSKHTKEKLFFCDLCSKGFPIKRSLAQHLTYHYKPTKVCKICDVAFYANATLRQHLQKHIGKAPFRCEICNKDFYTKHNLNTHKLIHTDEKAFRCTMCDGTYKIQAYLKKHIKLCHGK